MNPLIPAALCVPNQYPAIFASNQIWKFILWEARIGCTTRPPLRRSQVLAQLIIRLAVEYQVASWISGRLNIVVRLDELTNWSPITSYIEVARLWCSPNLLTLAAFTCWRQPPSFSWLDLGELTFLGDCFLAHQSPSLVARRIYIKT